MRPVFVNNIEWIGGICAQHHQCPICLKRPFLNFHEFRDSCRFRLCAQRVYRSILKSIGCRFTCLAAKVLDLGSCGWCSPEISLLIPAEIFDNCWESIVALDIFERFWLLCMPESSLSGLWVPPAGPRPSLFKRKEGNRRRERFFMEKLEICFHCDRRVCFSSEH